MPPIVDAAVKQQDNMLRRAVALGVKIAVGTGTAVFPHGQNAEEFPIRVDIGAHRRLRYAGQGGISTFALGGGR